MKKSIIHPDTRKLLFLYNDPKLLRRLMASPFAPQNVVIPCKNRSELISLIATNEPHLVVIASDHVGTVGKEVEVSLRNMAFHTRILVLPGECLDDQRLDAIWLSLRSCSRDPLCVELILSTTLFSPQRASNRLARAVVCRSTIRSPKRTVFWRCSLP